MFCTCIYMLAINIISVNLKKYFFAYLLSTYLIAASEKFQILKSGSDYQGAWPPLPYRLTFLSWTRLKIANYRRWWGLNYGCCITYPVQKEIMVFVVWCGGIVPLVVIVMAASISSLRQERYVRKLQDSMSHLGIGASLILATTSVCALS